MAARAVARRATFLPSQNLIQNRGLAYEMRQTRVEDSQISELAFREVAVDLKRSHHNRRERTKVERCSNKFLSVAFVSRGIDFGTTIESGARRFGKHT